MARSITRVATAGAATLMPAISDCGRLGAVPVDQPGGLVDVQPHLVDLDARLGDQLADHALLRQRGPERGPALRPVHHQRERPLGHADGPHGVVDPPGTQPGLGDGEAVALAGEQVGRRHPDVVEDELGVPVLVLVAEDGQVPDDRDAGGVPRHQDHRLLAVRLGVRRRSCPSR